MDSWRKVKEWLPLFIGALGGYLVALQVTKTLSPEGMALLLVIAVTVALSIPAKV